MKKAVLYSLKDFMTMRTVLFVCLLGDYILRWNAHVLLSQLNSPVLKYPSVDLLYWFLHLLHLPQAIVTNFYCALAFDVLLFFSILACLIFYRKSIFPVLYTFLAFLYFIIFNSYAGYHFHITVALFFMGLPFCFHNLKHFSFALYFIRIYYLFIFFSAFLWKLCRGSAFYSVQFVNIIKANNLEHLASGNDAWLDAFTIHLIQNPELAFGIYISAVLLQASFMVGLFTFKADSYFFWAAIFFCMGNYLFLRINSFELILFNLSLLKPGQLNLFFQKWHSLTKVLRSRTSTQNDGLLKQ